MTSSQPSIDCFNQSSIYECVLSKFRTALPDYQFPSFINHTDGFTNDNVTKVSAVLNQNIVQFPTEIFALFKNLTEVLMIYVGMESIDEDFENCANLEKLEIRYNALSNFPNRFLRNCTKLKFLNLGPNKISSIPEDIFYGLPALDTVSLDNNLIEIIPENIFAQSLNLRFVKLDNNKLREIPKNLFKNNKEIWFLTIESNPLQNTNLPEEIFDNLKLQILHLFNMGIVDLPKRIFADKYALREIYCGNNKIKMFENGLFDTTPQLRIIDFSNNEIENIENDAFKFAKLVTDFVFENNKLSFLNTKVFKNMTNLKYMKMKGNPIKAISHDFFQVLIMLQTFDFDNFECAQNSSEDFKVSLSPCYANILQCKYGTNNLYGYSCNLIDAPTSSNFKRIIDEVDREADVVYVYSSVSPIPVDIFSFNTVKTGDFSGMGLINGLEELANCSESCDSVEVLILDNNNFTEVPTEIGKLKNLQNISLTNCQITQFDSRKYPGLINLKILNLSNNFLKFQNFEKFINLEILDLRRNRLEKIVEFSFRNSSKLEQLLLDRNYLEVLQTDAFYGLRNLKILSISFNYLKAIEDNTFAPLLSLDSLVLSHNQLSSINPDKFGSNMNIKDIDFSFNKIQLASKDSSTFFNALRSINPVKFSDNSSIQNFDMSSNKVSYDLPGTSTFTGNICVEIESCVEDNTILCDFNYDNNIYECLVDKAKVVSKKSDFTIAGNHMGTKNAIDVTAITADSDSYFSFVPPVVFKTFPNLRTLSFQRVMLNHLSEFFNCKELREAYLNENFITFIEEKLFQQCTNLEVLNLEDNLIMKISIKSFNKLANLLFLNLGTNRIDELTTELFDNNQNLETLKFYNNKITEIRGEIFDFLKKLKYLSIYGNQIKVLPNDTLIALRSLEIFEMQSLTLSAEIPNMIFFKNAKLQILEMHKNKIGKIDELLFENQEQLEELCLQSCKISEIHENSFKNLRNLKHLDLQTNLLTKIEAKLMANLENLVELNLYGNQIVTIGNLDNLRGLKVLRIDENNFSKLDPNFIKNCTSLTDFNVNKNKLTALDVNLFQNSVNLINLDIQDNQITTLSNKTFQNLYNLKMFNLNSNKIAKIEPGIFSNMANVEKIILHDNLISVLNPKMFENLTKLSVVDFSRNKLTSIKADAFQNSQNFEVLKEVILADNKIVSIETQSFRYIPSLKTLDLRNNQIEILTSNIFTDKPNATAKSMDIIDVSGNRINKISDDFFVKIHPEKFDATGNVCLNGNYRKPYFNNSIDLKDCRAIILECRNEIADNLQHKCIIEFVTVAIEKKDFYFEVVGNEISKENLKVVEFLYSGLDFIPKAFFIELKNLETLIAKNVRMTNLSRIENCANLKTLILDENYGINLGNQNLENCKKLEVLSINKIGISSILSAFYGLTSLKEIQMESSKIQNLKFFIPKSVEILKLSDNFLKIEADTFEDLPNLKEIYVDSYNGTSHSEGERRSYQHLTKLEILEISSRGLTNQNFPTFNYQNNLKILKCNKNQLRELNDGMFKNLTNLIEIHMENNNINNLRNYTFSHSLNLEVINIQNVPTSSPDGNLILTLDTNAFYGLKKLRILLLGGNSVSKIPKSVFQDLESLETLSLYSNSISMIEPMAFSNLVILKYLDLSGNIFEENLHYDIFVNSQQLEVLNLQNCKLKSLPSSLGTLKNLKSVNLAQNFLESFLFQLSSKYLNELDFSSNNISIVNRKFLNSKSGDLKILGTSNTCTRNSDFEKCFLNFDDLNFCEFEENQKFGLTCKISNSSGNSNDLQQKKDVQYLYNKNKPLEVEVYVIFEIYENLTTVELWKSAVTDVNAIKSCEKLKNLDLRLNLIQNLNENVFFECKNLERLILVKNKISNVDKNALKGLKLLNFLDLSFNEIEILESGTFYENSELEKLLLGFNKISVINSGLFSNLKSLKVLKFFNNLLTEINNTKIFESQSNILEIHLNSNKLTYIQPEIFSIFEKLKYLNLEKNNLTKINLKLLNSEHFHYFDISFNNATEILIDFQKLKNFKSFFGEGNFCIKINFEVKNKIQAAEKLKECQKIENVELKDEL